MLGRNPWKHPPTGDVRPGSTPGGTRARHSFTSCCSAGLPWHLIVGTGDQCIDAPVPLRPAHQVEDHHTLVLAAGNRLQVLLQFDAHHHAQRIPRRISVEESVTDLLNLVPGELHDADPPVSISDDVGSAGSVRWLRTWATTVSTPLPVASAVETG